MTRESPEGVRLELTAEALGDAAIDGAEGRTVGTTGAVGCADRRPTNGSMRCARAEGRTGACGDEPRESGSAGLLGSKFLAGGCGWRSGIGFSSGTGATIFGLANCGRFAGRWNGETFLAA